MSEEKFDITLNGVKGTEYVIIGDNLSIKGYGQVTTGDGMTKEEAKTYVEQKLPPGASLLGWKAGTCQGVFQFYCLKEGVVIELAHNEDPPSGRKAAIEWTRAKTERR